MEINLSFHEGNVFTYMHMEMAMAELELEFLEYGACCMEG